MGLTKFNTTTWKLINVEKVFVQVPAFAGTKNKTNNKSSFLIFKTKI